MRRRNFINRNERGVALIIVLLVTALLITLVFEFAYGTRISLRAAVNFRDNQRAYYIARSGVNVAGLLLSDNLKNGKAQDNIEQREWQPVPIMTGSDTVLNIRWEDEAGKIPISTVVKGNDAYKRLTTLFDLRGVSQEFLDRMAEDKKSFRLLSELHAVLSEEDYLKIKDFVTVSPIGRININTAPVEVLQSIGMSAGLAGMVKDKREREVFKKMEEVNAFLGPENTMIAGMLDVTSNLFKVNSYASVGGYTKQVEAVISRTTSGSTINYWRAI